MSTHAWHDGSDDEPDAIDHHELHKVEALLRAAGDYVEPSRDLRPRLLESVRVERRRRSHRTRVSLAAAVAIVAAVAGGAQMARLGHAVNEASARGQIARSLEASEAATPAGVDTSIWRLVDAFWRVRERQANALLGPHSASLEKAESDSLDLPAQIPATRDSE